MESNSIYAQNAVTEDMNQTNFRQQEEISQNYLMYRIKNLSLLVVKSVAIQNCTKHKLQLDGMF